MLKNRLFIIILLSYIVLITPMRANQTFKLVSIPITKYNFVFKVAPASLVDTLEEEIGAIKDSMNRDGILSVNKSAILFLDYDPPEQSDLYSQKTKRTQNINENLLTQRYGAPTIYSYRRAAYGLLIYPKENLSVTDNINVELIENIVLKGYQVLKGDADSDAAYTLNDRIADRISMLKWMSLNEKKYGPFIGMLEMDDQAVNAITFMALTGDREAFLSKFNIGHLGLVK